MKAYLVSMVIATAVVSFIVGQFFPDNIPNVISFCLIITLLVGTPIYAITGGFRPPQIPDEPTVVHHHTLYMVQDNRSISVGESPKGAQDAKSQEGNGGGRKRIEGSGGHHKPS